MSVLRDAAARERIRHDFDATLVVEAAAGTGKTTELVRRIAGLLRSGRTTLERIVAVTFTDKAAGEMKLRLRARLERERQDAVGDELSRLDAALEALEAAHLGTIHAFCVDLLRERPVQAGVDPAFEVVADNGPLIERAFDSWYQRKLDDPPPSLSRVLALRRWERGRGPRDTLLASVQRLVERRDFDTPWQRPAFDRDAQIDVLVRQVSALGDWAQRAKRGRDDLARCLQHFAALAEKIREREPARGRDHDLLEYELRTLHGLRDAWGRKGRGDDYADGVPRQQLLDQRASLRDQLGQFVSRAEADLAAALQEQLREVVNGYQDLKARAGALDYLDMLLFVRDMLRSDAAVRAELQARFSHLFVDEFQDTDPLQAEILLLIASNDPQVDRYRDVCVVPGKLFVVGDPKQAIYRFRRADVVLYQEIKQRLCSQGAELLHLTTSFRSLPAIQAAVNHAFEPLMQARPDEPWQPEYVRLDEFRGARAGQPAVVALPVPAPYSQYGYLSNDAIRASEPEAVAAFVEWLVRHSDWQVTERRDGRDDLVPLRARHVCLLFKAMHIAWIGDVTRPYARELEARRMPHVLVGGRAYHGREEIVALRAALTAIEWPDDELAVYAALRGPFFSIGDDALLAYRSLRGRLRVFERRNDALVTSEVVEALSIIGALHRRRNHRPIAATINDLLQRTRAHAGIAIWPTGEQALANLMRSMDEARRFEHAGATSFRAFVEHLERQALRGHGAEAPVLEEGTDGVRIMTVHGAKGLEFPVVVLCDLANRRVSKRPSRWVDARRSVWAFPLAGCVPADLRDNAAEVLAQDEAEGVRVGYVAATRARDLLVVPAVGDARRAGWVDVLHHSIYPPRPEQRRAVQAPGCPVFGHDSVGYRPIRGNVPPPDESIMPGWHQPRAGGPEVVWWDPNALRLGAAPIGGLRQTDLLAQDDGGESFRGDEQHRAWRDRRDRTIETAAQPRRVVRTVTSLAAECDDVARGSTVEVASTDVSRAGRPRGARFGTVVHAVLAAVPLDADDRIIRRLAAAHATMAGAPGEECDAAVDAVRAALRHPLMQRAAAAETCRREAPVVVGLDDGSLAEGVVDLAFREAGRWCVVDFKTDADDSRFDAYGVQVGLYARAIGTATGEPVDGFLLRV